MRRQGCGGCLVWMVSFWPFAAFVAWPFMAFGNGTAGWIAAGIWWSVLVLLADLAPAARHR